MYTRYDEQILMKLGFGTCYDNDAQQILVSMFQYNSCFNPCGV